MLKMAHCFLSLRECTFFISTEYQAAILHLKREHKEEIETLKVYFLIIYFFSVTGSFYRFKCCKHIHSIKRQEFNSFFLEVVLVDCLLS